jgi:hypothetical protein
VWTFRHEILGKIVAVWTLKVIPGLPAPPLLPGHPVQPVAGGWLAGGWWLRWLPWGNRAAWMGAARPPPALQEGMTVGQLWLTSSTTDKQLLPGQPTPPLLPGRPACLPERAGPLLSGRPLLSCLAGLPAFLPAWQA